MLCRVVLVSIGLAAQAYAPLQMMSHGLKGLATLPEGFPGSVRDSASPQDLAISNAADTISPRRIPYFSARPDQTITWDDMAWCLAANSDQLGSTVRVNKCTGEAVQRWNWIPNGLGSNTLQLQDTNMCLGVRVGNDLNGAPMELQDCRHSVTETWKLENIMTGASASLALTSNRRHTCTMLSLLALAGVGVLSFSAGLRLWQAKRHTAALSQACIALRMDQEGGVALAARRTRCGLFSMAASPNAPKDKTRTRTRPKDKTEDEQLGADFKDFQLVPDLREQATATAAKSDDDPFKKEESSSSQQNRRPVGRLVGIDLGTTNSAIAVLRDGEPVMVPNSLGAKTTPSTVSYTSGGTVLVGQPALEQAADNVANTFYAAKRFIGRSLHQIKDYAGKVSFAVNASDEGDAIFSCPALPEPISPEEVSAQVLRALLDDAERETGERAERAVLTIPAYFSERQSEATELALRIAGVTQVDMIKEPVSACIAHRITGATGTVLVFDLGAGTFDTSVIRLLESGQMVVVATSGDPQLGGNDFDVMITDWLANEASKLGYPVRGNAQKMRHLADAAEAAKIQLSYAKSVMVRVPTGESGEGSADEFLEIELSQKKIEELCQPLFSRLRIPILEVALQAGITLPGEEAGRRDGKMVKKLTKKKERLLEKAGRSQPRGKQKIIPKGQGPVDEVILVGGVTRMAAVRKFVTNVFGVPPRRTVDPMQAVALGAAVHAGVLEGEIRGLRVMQEWQASLADLMENFSEDDIDPEEQAEEDAIVAAWLEKQKDSQPE